MPWVRQVAGRETGRAVRDKLGEQLGPGGVPDVIAKRDASLVTSSAARTWAAATRIMDRLEGCVWSGAGSAEGIRAISGSKRRQE